MTRYQALRRHLGCGPLTAGFIALMNWARDVPSGHIVFLTLHIEFDPTPTKGQP